MGERGLRGKFVIPIGKPGSSQFESLPALAGQRQDCLGQSLFTLRVMQLTLPVAAGSGSRSRQGTDVRVGRHNLIATAALGGILAAVGLLKKLECVCEGAARGEGGTAERDGNCNFDVVSDLVLAGSNCGPNPLSHMHGP